MKKLQLILLFSLLLTACAKDTEKEEEPIFVTNIAMPSEGTVFKPGDKVTISAQGFQANDEIMFEMRWPRPDDPVMHEGYAIGVRGVITERTSTSITFLAPGHYPASTTKVLLVRTGDRMTLGSIRVANGEAPEEFQLYGIVNSKTNSEYPHSIERIDRETGAITKIESLADGQDFSCVINLDGSQSLYGIRTQDGVRSVYSYDLSMRYWQSSGMHNILTLCSNGSSAIALRQVDPNHVVLDAVSSWLYTRLPQPADPILELPDGITPESLTCYPGVQTEAGYMLFSADKGDGKFVPVIVTMQNNKPSMYASDEIEANALIPFWIVELVKDTGRDKYVRVGGYAVVTNNGTELRLWDTTAKKMEEPFATYPNQACSITSHMKSADTQELYVLFYTGRGAQLIEIYNMLTKEWTSVRGFNYPYSEIVMAR